MALFIKQNEERSELQQRVAAELQEKAKSRLENEHTPPDGVTDSQYLKGTKTTTALAWVWAVVIAIAVIVALGFIFFAK